MILNLKPRSPGACREVTPPPATRGPNWANQTIWTGDCLDVMRGMNSASVDLIYLDPPFNSNHDYAAPIGSPAAGAAFKDTWGLDDVNLAWHGEIKHAGTPVSTRCWPPPARSTATR